MSSSRYGLPVGEQDRRCDALIARERLRTGGGDSLTIRFDPAVVNPELPPRKVKRGVRYRVKLPDGRQV